MFTAEKADSRDRRCRGRGRRSPLRVRIRVILWVAAESRVRRSKTLVVGSQDYYSNEIIAEIYSQALGVRRFHR